MSAVLNCGISVKQCLIEKTKWKKDLPPIFRKKIAVWRRKTTYTAMDIHGIFLGSETWSLEAHLETRHVKTHNSNTVNNLTTRVMDT